MHKTGLTKWLLGSNIPSIRYRTLVDLLECPPDDERVMQARQEIMSSGPVPVILSGQSNSGKWKKDHDYYTPQFFSTHWNMTLLAELDVDGQDPRFQRGVEYMLKASAPELDLPEEARKRGFACFWGNLIRYSLHAGRAADPQLQKIIQRMEWNLVENASRCCHNGGLPCTWGLVRNLWGLAIHPAIGQDPRLDEAIQAGTHFLLDSYNLDKADFPRRKGAAKNPLWYQLNYPLYYQVDILFVLGVLDELGRLNHPSTAAALDWLESRARSAGPLGGCQPLPEAHL